MIRKTFWQNVTHDLKYALKAIGRRPGFSIAVVLTVAFGIGANTTMFSVIRAVLLKPLEYRQPNQLVIVTEGATPDRALEIAGASRSYTEVGTFTGFEDVALSGSGVPEQLKGVRVSANFLSILGVSALQGRGFLAEEDQPGAAPVAMISAELWRRRFGRSPAVVGKTVTLAGSSTTIIGVLPPGFQFPMAADTDVWLPRPAEWSVLQPKSRPVSPFLSVFGRLKDSVDVRSATAELAVLDQQYAAAHPDRLDAKRESPDTVVPMKENLISDVQSKLWMLFGAVGFVLLIVCANVGGLFLTRTASRAREFAVRAAIGAGRGRIIGQLLAESTFLAVVGGGLGVVLAAVSLRSIRSITFVDLPRSGEVKIDLIVLGFAAVLSILSGVAFGLAPALAVSTPHLASVLRGSGEGDAHSKLASFIGSRSLLVVGQVSLSVVLLIGAALLIESLWRVYQVDPGFQPAGVLAMDITLTPARYDSDEKKAAFYERLLQRLQTLPSVRGAALATTLPMTDRWMGTTFELTTRADSRMTDRPIAVLESVTPEYFRTLRVAVKRGTVFDTRDDIKSPPVAMISESAARILWPEYPNGAEPVGQHILVGTDTRATEIIGIAADVHQAGKDVDPKPVLYLPCLQKPPNAAMLAVRTDGNPLGFANAVRARVLEIDPDQPVSNISTLDDIVDASEGQLRLMMRLLGAFAAVATVLAVIGLYSVVSYSVVQRTKEIGIRRALGAPTGNVVGLVARQTITLALAGVVLGVGGALLLTRLMGDLLFQVRPNDPATFAAISILFVIVAVAAGYIPARRASGIDPIEALRS